uniref:Uncharacterized protein n=1 Tax=Populus trichocarpa TaxID=3694 RepID=A0A2K1XD19_POPTR
MRVSLKVYHRRFKEIEREIHEVERNKRVLGGARERWFLKWDLSSGLEQNGLRIIQCQVDRKAVMFNQFWKMLYWNERSLEWGRWHHLRV